jgi:hypothetical protein
MYDRRRNEKKIKNKKNKIKKGIAQGSTLSPTAWAIAIDKLLNKIDGPVTGVGFPDDVCMLMTGFDLNTMLNVLQKSFKRARNWAEEAGLEFGAEKSKYVVFTNKKRKANDINTVLSLARTGENGKII